MDPHSTSWSLLNACSNEVVVEVEPGFYGNSMGMDTSMGMDMDLTSYDYERCVPANGRYTFTIRDQHGDGICCTNGEGGYTLTKDGETLKEGGDFGESEETSWGGCGPTPAPVPPCAEDENHVHLDLMTHKWSTSIEWSLTDKCTGEVVEQKGQGVDYTVPFPFVDRGRYYIKNHLYQEDYCVPHSTYEFKMETRVNGGLCCV
jgi:hypothetical protein